MNRLTWVGFGMLFLSGCATTGGQMRSLHEGMSRDAVISQMGQPDGMQKQGALEKLDYSNRQVPWTDQHADYYVILKDNAVVAYGTGQIRESQNNVSWIIPLDINPHPAPMPPPPPRFGR